MIHSVFLTFFLSILAGRGHQSTYLIDRESNVYIYLDELKAAVESEYAYACDENGDQIAFSVQEARRFPVLSMEAALEQLSMI